MPRRKGFRYTRAVYALVHRDTKKLYIGSTERLEKRWERWRSDMQLNPQNLPASFPSREPEDWDFKVIHTPDPDISSEDLRKLEWNFIKRAVAKAPHLVLNAHKEPNEEMQVRVGTDVVPLAEAARRTGIRYQTLLMRWKAGDRGQHLIRKTPGRQTYAQA